jgi:ribosomal protein S2
MLKKKINIYLINFLLASQMHIGSKKKKWNQSLNMYLFGIRENIHFFNLKKTHLFLKKVSFFLRKSIIKHHSFIFIGTGSLTQPLINYLSQTLNQPNISISWVGGNLTNWFTIKNYCKLLYSKNLKKYLTFKFELKSQKKLDQKIHKYLKMKKKLKGLETACLFPNIVISLEKELNKFMLHEAFILKLPSICIINSNNPFFNITYPILGNSKSFESLSFYSNIILHSIKYGFLKRRIKFLKYNYDFIDIKKGKKSLYNVKKIKLFLKKIKEYNIFSVKKLIRRNLYYTKAGS